MHEISLDGLEILWYGHASFRITDGERFIYIDPYVLPEKVDKADIILISHEHFDHCDVKNVGRLRKNDTKVFGAPSAVKKLGFGSSMQAGRKVNVDGVTIEAVEAYNINKKFHPRGLGVGFVITVDRKTIYHAGDTDNIKEMALLRGRIDVALLPIGGTYTMTASEAAEAAKAIKPKYLVPMHYNSDKYGVAGINANPADVAKALAGQGIIVNILNPLV